jgi:dissimilatory sulfite reductase (desulfoviridin) alpha/beta subunit
MQDVCALRCQERVNRTARGVLNEIAPELWQMMVDGEDVGGCYRKGCQQHCPHHAADLSQSRKNSKVSNNK